MLTAQDAGFIGTIPDEQHLALARDQQRVLLTADRDLLAIAHSWNTDGRAHPGVIFYHPGWTTVGHVAHEVHSIAHGLGAEALANRTLFVTWDRRPPGR